MLFGTGGVRRAHGADFCERAAGSLRLLKLHEVL